MQRKGYPSKLQTNLTSFHTHKKVYSLTLFIPFHFYIKFVRTMLIKKYDNYDKYTDDYRMIMTIVMNMLMITMIMMNNMIITMMMLNMLMIMMITWWLCWICWCFCARWNGWLQCSEAHNLKSPTKSVKNFCMFFINKG